MRTTFAAIAASLAFAAPAMAWEGQTIKCYGKVWSPAQYSVKEVLVKPARHALEHKANGQLAEVYYPPVYKEVKTRTHKAHWIMREEACRHD